MMTNGARPLGHDLTGRAHRYPLLRRPLHRHRGGETPSSQSCEDVQGVGLVARSLAAGQQLRGRSAIPRRGRRHDLCWRHNRGRRHRGGCGQHHRPKPFSRTACPALLGAGDDVRSRCCPKKPSNRRLQTGDLRRLLRAFYLRIAATPGWRAGIPQRRAPRFGQASSTNPTPPARGSAGLDQQSLSLVIETGQVLQHAQCEESAQVLQSASRLRNRLAAPRCGAFRPSASALRLH